MAGLQRSSSGAVTASTLKRTLLRKDPTFNEADYGFRAFGELLRHLAGHNVVELSEGSAKGDPDVTLPEHGDREAAFGLLRSVVFDLAGNDGSVALSGLKNQVRKVRARLQREETRLPQLSPVLQGGGDQRSCRPEMELRR